MATPITEPELTVTAPAPSLRSSFAWTLAGYVIYAGCQWGMLSVLAKLGSPSVVGRFALGIAITSPVFMFTNLQLRGVQATDARSEFEFADYFTLRCLATLAGLCIVAAVVAVSGYDRSTALVVLLVALSKAIESLSDVVAGLLQKFERLDLVAIGLMIRGVVSVGAFGLVFWRTKSLIATTVTLALAWTAVVLAYDFHIARRVMVSDRRFFRANGPVLRKLVSLSLPLGLVMSLIALNTNIPRYIVERRLGASELGIFASLAYIVVAISLVVSALGQSAVVRLARYFAAGEVAGFISILKRLVLIGAAISIIGLPLTALIGRPIVRLLYTPQYAQQMPLLLVIVATAGVNAIASFLGYGLTAARLFKVQIPIAVAATICTLTLTLALIKPLHLFGAATALFISAIVQCVASAIVLRTATAETHQRNLSCAQIAPRSCSEESPNALS